jgi:hypothetical protein
MIQDHGSKNSPSFTTVAAILGSPSLKEPAPLGRLLAALPEKHYDAASWSTEPAPLPIEPEWFGKNNWQAPAMSTSVWIHNVPSDLCAPILETQEKQHENIWTYISTNYPQLSELTFPSLQHGSLRGTSILLQVSTGLDYSEIMRNKDEFLGRVHFYRGSWYALPVLSQHTSPMHPLITWWACLWTLSMLARYVPDRWVTYLDVDSNPRAVPLEEILNSALSALPELLVQEFRNLQSRYEYSRS